MSMLWHQSISTLTHSRTHFRRRRLFRNRCGARLDSNSSTLPTFSSSRMTIQLERDSINTTWPTVQFWMWSNWMRILTWHFFSQFFLFYYFTRIGLINRYCFLVFLFSFLRLRTRHWTITIFLLSISCADWVPSPLYSRIDLYLCHWFIGEFQVMLFFESSVWSHHPPTEKRT